MGNGGSRDAVDVATLRQGLELIGRWALLLARKSPQMIDRWEELEERLQTAEADIEILQDNVGRVTERLTRLEDREKTRETRVATLETSIEKALSTMFPRVDALLTHLEEQKNSSETRPASILKEDQMERVAVSESANTKLSAAEVSSAVFSVSDIPAVNSSVEVAATVVSSGVSSEGPAVDARATGGKRKHQKGTMEHTNVSSALGPVSCVTSQCSPLPPKRLASDTNALVSATPSTSSTPDASPTPSTSSTASVQQADLEDALLSAVVGRKVGDLRCLLAAGADVNAVNIYGQTPVALAASRGYTDCLSALLFAGGSANNENRDLNGHLPIHAAAIEGQVTILPLLLSAGADINARTEPAAHTPLMLAASEGHHAFLSVLLQQGAEVNIQDNSGETVLHKAVRGGNKQSVSLLLDAGVNVNLVDKLGCSSLHYAHQLQRRKIKKMLISAGARKIP